MTANRIDGVLVEWGDRRFYRHRPLNGMFSDPSGAIPPASGGGGVVHREYFDLADRALSSGGLAG